MEIQLKFPNIYTKYQDRKHEDHQRKQYIFDSGLLNYSAALNLTGNVIYASLMWFDAHNP